MRVSGALMVISGPLNMGSTVAIIMTKVEDAGKGQAVVCTAQFYDCAKICAENIGAKFIIEKRLKNRNHS